MAKSDPDEIRRLGSRGQQANAEELLAELARLVESSGLAGRSPPIAQTMSKSSRMDAGLEQAFEGAPLRPPVDVAPSKSRGRWAVRVEPRRATESNNSYSDAPVGNHSASRRRFRAWTFKVSALVLAGAAVVGAVFWFERDEPGLPKAPSFVARAQGPSIAQPRSDLTVTSSSAAPSSSDPGAALRSDVTQPAQATVGASEAPPIDPDVRASRNDQARSADSGSPAAGEASPAPVASAEGPLAASAATAQTPPPTSPLDSKPEPMVSLPAESPPLVTPTPAAADAGQAAHASDAPLPPVRAASTAAEAVGNAHRSTPKLELPIKLSSKSGAHAAVAKAEATAPGASEERPSQPLRRAAPIRPEKRATTPKPAHDPAEAQAIPPEPPAPAPTPQPNPNPVMRTFNSMVGALAGLNPFANH